MRSTWQLSVSFSPREPRPTIWEESKTASTSRPAQAVWSGSKPRWVPTLTNTRGHGSFRSLPAPTLPRPEQCPSTRPRSHALGLSSARRPACDHESLPQAGHGSLPPRADAPTDTDSHSRCCRFPLPSACPPSARRAPGAPGAYPPGACAGASARFRGNLLLVFREKPTVISREIVAGKPKPTFISR